MEIEMTSSPMFVKRIIKKTDALMFSELQVGNRILFAIVIEKQGVRPSGGSYAPYIRCQNLDNNGENNITFKSFNQLSKILECFDLY
jgi:hypothetical protein